MANLYTQSGVDIDAGNESVSRIKSHVATTHTSAVLGGIGGFGGLYDIGVVLKSYTHPVLVQSIDGVGTKLSVAKMAGIYDTVGEDIVNHCCNDLLAMGARPLTFLDYVAHDKLDPQVMESMVKGMSKACRESEVSLIGGETAEMPGVYMSGEHDIAGCITGVVEKDQLITGEHICKGDVILGFPSSGLHTNGFSLARKILFEIAGHHIDEYLNELGTTVGEALLKVHVNYAQPVLAMLDNAIDIRGIAHITGGGFIENIPRVLSTHLSAQITKDTWPLVPIFPYIQNVGKVSELEMYRVFNMGIGLVLIVPPTEKQKIRSILKSYPGYQVYEIGKIINGDGTVLFT